MPNYDADFYGWANEQAALLRAGRLSDADVLNIAEEIESMGRSEKRELVNRLAVLLMHMLKWQFQPGMRGNLWRLTIEEQRRRLASHLKDNPSLKGKFAESLDDAYELAILAAQRETGFARSAFPAANPYDASEVLDDGFYPQ